MRYFLAEMIKSPHAASWNIPHALVVNRILLADFCDFVTDVICFCFEFCCAKLDKLAEKNHVLLLKAS